MSTRVAALIAGAIVLAGVLVAGAIVWTSNDDNSRPTGNQSAASNKALEPLTREEWQAKVLAAGARATANWDLLESGIADDCTKDASDWAIRLSLDPMGVSTDIPRAGLEWKCPEQVAAFDQGMERLRDTTLKVDELCNAPYDSLSSEDQDWVDAVCVP